jgi:hypothetical protein
VDWIYFYQPRATTGSNIIATEAIDPPLFDCLENPEVGCRHSDAALAVYESGVGSALGYIARPVNRNPLAPPYYIDPANPTFHVVGQMNWAVDGEIMEKVGRTTGWTGGEVIDGCISRTADSAHGGYTVQCAMIVDAEVGGGDSGSPVFKIVSGTDIELRGMVFAGDGDCGTMLDPVFTDREVLACTMFAAANLGGISQDFEHLLTYYSPPPPPPPMTVTINGPSTWPPYQQVTVQASVSNGTPPFTYAWQVNGVPYCGNESWCSKAMGGPGTQTYFYVTVTDGDGDHASDYHVVFAQY